MIKLLKKELMEESDSELNSDFNYSDAVGWINSKKKFSVINVNEKTLRNWWQGKVPKTIPTKSRLTLIAKCLGYKSWDSFCEIKSRHTTLYSFFDPLELKVENMQVGKPYMVGWFPQHYVELEYLGKYKFRIMDCSSSYNFKIGDEREIYGFGIIYTKHMNTVYDDSGKKFEVEGYPLHPTITIRTNKTESNNIDNHEHSFIHING
jgi:hypothetical protein